MSTSTGLVTPRATTAAIAVAIARLAASLCGEEDAAGSRAVAEASTLYERSVEQRQTRALERERRVDEAADRARALLTNGPATERQLVSAARARCEVMHEALHALLVRGEVTRTARGYCLKHVAPVAA